MRIPHSLLVAALSLTLGSCKTMHMPKWNFGKKADAEAGETEKDRGKRETAESSFLEECKKLGESGDTVTGKDGWIFSGKELKQLGATPEVGSGSFSSAVTAISDYRRQLKQSGVEMVVVVVPPKALIYADKVSKEAKVPLKKGVPVPLDSYYVAATEALAKKGVKVISLTEAFLKERKGKGGAPFVKGSAKFTPSAAKLIAQTVAEEVGLSKGEAGMVSKDLEFTGGNELGGKEEKLTARQIFRADGSTPVSLGETGNTILIIADNTVKDWKDQQASLAEQLSFESQRNVGVLSGSSARNEQRLKIMRQGTTSKNPLSGTKLVVWVCNALELASGDWDVVPLKLEFKMSDPTIRIN